MSDWLKQIPKGMTFPRSHYLRDLREIDIENLICGRITNWTMMEAVRRSQEQVGFYPHHFEIDQRQFPTDTHRILADELNDMLRAAKGGEL